MSYECWLMTTIILLFQYLLWGRIWQVNEKARINSWNYKWYYVFVVFFILYSISTHLLFLVSSSLIVRGDRRQSPLFLNKKSHFLLSLYSHIHTSIVSVPAGWSYGYFGQIWVYKIILGSWRGAWFLVAGKKRRFSLSCKRSNIVVNYSILIM